MGKPKKTFDPPRATRFHRDQRVADALDLDPRVAEILEREFGLPCHRCVVAEKETLAEGCAPLGLEVATIVARLEQLEPQALVPGSRS